MPDLRLEQDCEGLVAGIDEVGRGPWAGPVVAAAVILDPASLPDDLTGTIDDSKKLSAAKREDIAARLCHCARIGIGAATISEIGTHSGGNVSGYGTRGDSARHRARYGTGRR